MGWSIQTPFGIEPATIDGSGHATFNKNTGNSVVYYTVTYTDSEGTKCVAKVKQKGNPCTYVYTKNTENIPVEGGRYVFGTLSNVQGQSMTVEVTHGKIYINPYPPGDIVIDGNELVANVFKNTGGTRDIKYKIYADNKDCGAGEHTNSQDSNNCSCDTDLTLDYNSETWAWNETTVKQITITSADCISDVTLSVPSGSKFNANLEGNKIVTSPIGQNTSDAAYTNRLTLKYYAGTIDDCQKYINLRQEASNCACSDLRLGGTSLAWDWNGVDWKSISITSAQCITNIAKNSLTNFTAEFVSNAIRVKPNGQNTGGSARNETITITYTAGSRSCSSAITLSQGIKDCDCGDFTYTEYTTKMYGNAARTVELGEFTGVKEGCSALISVSSGKQRIKQKDGSYVEKKDFDEFHIETYSSGVLVLKGVMDYNPYMGENVHEDVRGGGRLLKYDITIGGVKCGTYGISQQGWRGTDNGVDIYINPDDGSNIESKYPILMCYQSGDTNSDSVVCEEGAWWYNPNGGTTKAQKYTKITTDWNLYFGDNGTTATTRDGVPNAWLRVYLDPDRVGYCGVGFLAMKTLMDNTTGVEKKAVFWLSTDPDIAHEDAPIQPKLIMSPCESAGQEDCCTGGPDLPQHQGEECALKWRYEVWQAAKGYKWCRNHHIEPPYTSHVPMSYVCECGEGWSQRCFPYSALKIVEYESGKFALARTEELNRGDGNWVIKLLTDSAGRIFTLTGGTADKINDCYYNMYLNKDSDGSIRGINKIEMANLPSGWYTREALLREYSQKPGNFEVELAPDTGHGYTGWERIVDIEKGEQSPLTQPIES